MVQVKNEKLKIAHLHWGFPPVIGGVETHLTILLPTFVSMGHQASLLTCSFEGYPGKDEFKGVKIIREPIMDLNWLYKRGLGRFKGLPQQFVKNFIWCIKIMNLPWSIIY